MSLLFEWLENAVQDRTAAGGSGHAIIYHDTYLSWRGLLHRVERRARELAAMGIQAKDWVGLMLGNDPEFVVLTLALAKLDAVVVPIDPTTGGRDLDMILEAAPAARHHHPAQRHRSLGCPIGNLAPGQPAARAQGGRGKPPPRLGHPADVLALPLDQPRLDSDEASRSRAFHT
jgi:hypothetical protein